MRDGVERIVSRMVFGDTTTEVQSECERLVERLNSALKNTEGENNTLATETTNAQVGSGAVRRAVGADTLRAIQSFGRKSVFNLTTDEVAQISELRDNYAEELGTKSPFYRAEHGDWREQDDTPVEVATVPGNARGPVQNLDTGWDLTISGKVFHENGHKSASSRSAEPYLDYISDIVKKAVLLDSFTLDRAKSKNSLLMHSLYAVADIGAGPQLVKLYVEEMNDPNSDGTGRRAYQLQNIENQQAGVQGSGEKP